MVSILSFCLLVHSTGVHADISQLMVDQEGHTIKFRRDGGQLLFNDVVSGIVEACNMSTNATQPPASFTEQQYWSLINYNYKYNSYLSVFRDPNITDDAMMNQTLSCSSTTAQNIIVNSQIDNNLGYLVYLAIAIPIVLIGGVLTAAFIQRTCRAARTTVTGEIQLEQQDSQLPTQPLDSISITVTQTSTVSEVALSGMSGSATQSLDQSITATGI